jgi:hypothetical protein
MLRMLVPGAVFAPFTLKHSLGAHTPMKNLLTALVLATSFAAFAQDAKPATTTDATAKSSTSTKTKGGTTTTKKSTTKKSTTTKPAADKPADAAPAK